MNMFKGLLFLQGHFTRPEDLDDVPANGRTEYGAHTAANDFARPLGNRAASAAWFGRDPGTSPQVASHRRSLPAVRTAAPLASSRKRGGVLARLLYLGGRPMHAGHNLDVEEPFEQLAGDDGVAVSPPRRMDSAVSCVRAMQPCTG